MDWKLLSRICSFKTPWIELIGEHWQDDKGQLLDYWRTTTDDSLIIIPEQSGDFIFPNKIFRPGVGQMTLDFPGGRVRQGVPINTMAREILARELGVTDNSIIELENIYTDPKFINSSTSSQKLFGLYARLNGTKDDLLPHIRFGSNKSNLSRILEELQCLQCRALLLELITCKERFAGVR